MERHIFKVIFDKRYKNYPISPFTQWHLRVKFETMTKIFSKYLHPSAKMIDIACGDGDAIVLAKHCQPTSELWGIDINYNFLNIAKKRATYAKIIEGDMLNLTFLPLDHFDIVHEFGATFLLRNKEDLSLLAKQYFNIAKNDGIILWEFPPKWSMAHLSYMFTVAPKNTASDTKFKRIIRSFSFKKYSFFSDSEIRMALRKNGFQFEVLDRIPIWTFYCAGMTRYILDKLHRIFGDEMFKLLDKITRLIWPINSGYYLVIQKIN